MGVLDPEPLRAVVRGQSKPCDPHPPIAGAETVEGLLGLLAGGEPLDRLACPPQDRVQETRGSVDLFPGPRDRIERPPRPDRRIDHRVRSSRTRCAGPPHRQRRPQRTLRLGERTREEMLGEGPQRVPVPNGPVAEFGEEPPI